MTRAQSAPTPRDVAPSPSAAAPKYRDLCSTCSHAESCRGHSTPQRPIFFCEMFEVFAPEPVAARPVAAKPAEQEDTGRHKGLCVNCDNRDTCILPRPEGGVWHCQEYQ